MVRHTTNPRVRSLTIYLLKAAVRGPRDAVDRLDETRGFTVQIGDSEATLFVKPSTVSPPSWVRFFRDHISLDEVFLRSASSAAVLLVPVSGRWFAVTFGHGRHLLDRGSWEPNFGLKVTLNSIDDSSIRSIDRRSFDSISRHTKEEASRLGSIEQFGINVEEDLLRAVVGIPEEESLGRRMAGMDALTVSTSVTLEGLPCLLSRYLNQWQKGTYRQRYPWIDHVREIRDKRQSKDLDEEVVARIATGRLDQAWLAVPVPIDWSLVGGFRYAPTPKATIHEDIHLRTFLESLRDPGNVNAQALRRKSIYCLDPDGQHPLHKWSVYECVYAEVRRGNDVFLLTGGLWYRIASQFVMRVDADVVQVPSSGYDLPTYRHESEEAYNRDVALRDPNVALMDRRNVRYGGGSSQIEFCDLFVGKRRMLHVKRFGGSSVLSHLFSQGVVSGTLFVEDREFRREVRGKLPSSFVEGVPEERPQVDLYEVGFAIVSRSAGELVLPFFSKVNLRNAVRTLRGLGYRVTLTKIEVESGR
ncbi:MAG: TIGR04141 family sporadically distributed protein [Chloroflexi bacterium]|nr:TIGR04141 family sporadically distributed protein [Chloroflexota bacterium]